MTTLSRPRGWKTIVGALAVAGIALGSAAAGAAPPTVPGAPTIKSVKALDHAVRVSFTRPASNGGAHIIRYKATCVSSDGGTTGSNGGDNSSIRVGHLTPTKTYTCTVVARNKVGTGPASAPSATVIVLPNPAPTVPGAPTIKSVKAVGSRGAGVVHAVRRAQVARTSFGTRRRACRVTVARPVRTAAITRRSASVT